MEVLVERCAGLDVGKADLNARVRVAGPRGGRRQQIKTFATTTRALLELRQWPTDQHVTVVGVEATGDYWKPVYYLLEDAVEVQLLNAAHCTTCLAVRPMCATRRGSPGWSSMAWCGRASCRRRRSVDCGI
jgi:hypothetical protein